MIDPSAASFIATIRRHGQFNVRKADNHVLNGIRVTGTLLQSEKLLIHRSCEDSIREFGTYSWDEESQEDKVIKECSTKVDKNKFNF